ncbi:MAG: right-handed parallel beta-helix repeat-containing protein, partial [Verrucomicrobiota bacterium]
PPRPAPPPPANPRAVAEVLAGRRTEADPAWWGLDPADATGALQAAIDSGARRVRLRRQAAPWVVRPIRLRSHLELVFDPGVVVLAKAGEFRGRGDSLFTGTDREDVTLRGRGAVLRMRRADYQQPPYEKAEWRMGIAFRGCRNIRVEGLRLEDTGGDGIYIGSSPRNRWCENVVLRRCECVGNHRQGLSVTSAVRLRVEDCLLAGTAGTAPESGLDLEPDEADECLVGCRVRRCRFVDNQGSGALVYLRPLTARSAPVSIRFEDCQASMDGPGGGSGFTVGWARDDGPRGQVEFIRCTTRRTGREGARVVDKSADAVAVVFRECRFLDPWQSSHPNPAHPRAALLVHQEDADFC